MRHLNNGPWCGPWVALVCLNQGTEQLGFHSSSRQPTHVFISWQAPWKVLGSSHLRVHFRNPIRSEQHLEEFPHPQCTPRSVFSAGLSWGTKIRNQAVERVNAIKVCMPRPLSLDLRNSMVGLDHALMMLQSLSEAPVSAPPAADCPRVGHLLTLKPSLIEAHLDA